MVPAPKKSAKKSVQGVLEDINRDIKALNSSILIISQKMKHLARNEKILGRNLIVINRKVSDLRTQFTQRPVIENEEGEIDFSAVNSRFDEINSKLLELGEVVSQLSENSAKVEDLAEVKYVVDAIDPLKFVTMDQVLDLLKEKEGFKSKKKK